jgi:hypothetical protein
LDPETRVSSRHFLAESLQVLEGRNTQFSDGVISMTSNLDVIGFKRFDKSMDLR